MIDASRVLSPWPTLPASVSQAHPSAIPQSLQWTHRKSIPPLREYLAAWKQLIPLGYLPLCDYGDGWGPICYKFSDGSVIWFDHEQLHSLSSPVKPNSLQALERQLHPDLTTFFDELFGIRDSGS